MTSKGVSIPDIWSLCVCVCMCIRGKACDFFWHMFVLRDYLCAVVVPVC